jgi:plasmid stabilization system protein ParE
MRVELRAKAREDLLEGASFYEQQREQLGFYFLRCLYQDLERLESDAGIHELVFGLHRKLAKRFPFAIYYMVQKSVVDVVAILDCRRDPRSIEARLTQA